MTGYTYAPNGNLTTIDPPGASGNVRYGYDQRNLLITSTVDGSAVASFFYDGMNNRLRQVDYTGALPITTTYTNDILGLTQVLIADDGADQVINLFGLDLILQDDGTQDLILLTDSLGSVRSEMVADSVEAVTTYSPYGSVLAQKGDSSTVYGFTGEQEDGATGLLYLRARYYDSYIYQSTKLTRPRLATVAAFFWLISSSGVVLLGILPFILWATGSTIYYSSAVLQAVAIVGISLSIGSWLTLRFMRLAHGTLPENLSSTDP